LRLTLLTRWYVYGPVAILLLALVVVRARPIETLTTLENADWRPLIPAIALNVVVVALWVVRFGQLLRHHGHVVSSARLALIVLFANTASSLTPASTGEIGRVVVLERQEGIPMATGTAAVLVERFMALYLLAMTTGLAWIWLLIGHPEAGGAGLVIVGLALAFAPTLAYRAGLRPLRAIGTRLERRAADGGRLRRLGAQLVTIDERTAATISDARRTGVFVICSLLVFAVFAVQFSLAGAAIGVSLDLVTAWAVQGVAVVAGVLSAIPFGLGVSDAVVALLLPAAGVAPANAALIALLFRAVSTIPITILGVAAYVALSGSAGGRSRSTPVAGGEGDPAGGGQ
jgi:glycosyltransferase 2 family protein